MLIDLDLETSGVRLDDEGFAALLEAARSDGASGHPDAVAALATGRLERAVGALLRPAVSLELVAAGTRARLVHRGWVGPEAAALLLGVRHGERRLLTPAPAFLAAALVRLTRMKPRRVAERRDVAFPAERLPALIAEDPDLRAAALAEAGADFGWRLDLRWADGHRQLTAVDGPAGVHLADPETGLLQPVSNTTVYRIFSTALPPEALAAG